MVWPLFFSYLQHLQATVKQYFPDLHVGHAPLLGPSMYKLTSDSLLDS